MFRNETTLLWSGLTGYELIGSPQNFNIKSFSRVEKQTENVKEKQRPQKSE